MNRTAVGAKGQLGVIYATYSHIIDRVARFVFGLVLFGGINHITGYMKQLDNIIVVIGLAVICAFLPTPFLTLFGFVLLLAHLSALSLPVMGIVAVLFLIMFALYFHFTPGHTIMLLLIPISFWLKIPAVIPVAYGLMGTPAFAYPIACGVIAYFTLDSIQASAKTFDVSGLVGVMGRVSIWIRELFTNKEMWLYVFAFIVTLWVVNLIRRRDMNHAWKMATVIGALVDILILTIGGAVLGVKFNIGLLIIAHAAAIVAGLILEYLFYGVDYKHKESIQFEDDDYVYYVSAIPKVKGNEEDLREVKRLTHESEKKAEEKKPRKPAGNRPNAKKGSGQRRGQGSSRPKQGRPAPKKDKAPSQPKKEQKWKNGMTDELLMTQSLRRDLEKEL